MVRDKQKIVRHRQEVVKVRQEMVREAGSSQRQEVVRDRK